MSLFFPLQKAGSIVMQRTVAVRRSIQCFRTMKANIDILCRNHFGIRKPVAGLRDNKRNLILCKQADAVHFKP